jgi:hypothetical protein
MCCPSRPLGGVQGLPKPLRSPSSWVGTSEPGRPGTAAGVMDHAPTMLNA